MCVCACVFARVCARVCVCDALDPVLIATPLCVALDCLGAVALVRSHRSQCLNSSSVFCGSPVDWSTWHVPHECPERQRCNAVEVLSRSRIYRVNPVRDSPPISIL